MTDDMMSLRTLLAKSSDADLLREMVGFAAHRLMELEVESLTGADAADAGAYSAFSHGWRPPTGFASNTRNQGYFKALRSALTPVKGQRFWLRRRYGERV
jgi:hypothetical protein